MSYDGDRQYSTVLPVDILYRILTRTRATDCMTRPSRAPLTLRHISTTNYPILRC